MTKIYGYSRVSKREQAESSHALEQQQSRLRQAGATEIFSDIISGTKDDRPQFQRLMQLVREKRVDRVVVTRIDRLGRSLQSAVKVFKDFRESGVELIVLDGSVDLTTVGGRVQANIMAALAEMEADMNSERCKHGWEYLRQRRVAMNPPFGYRKVDNKHQLDHEPFLCLLDTREEMSRSAVARDMVRLFIERRSLRQAIRGFNTKYGIQKFQNAASPKTGFENKGVFQRSPSGLRMWLTNPVLRGHLAYLSEEPDRTQIIHDTHPDDRLITEEEFQEIGSILKINQERKGFGAVAPVYPLSGLVKCGVCGGTCYSSKASESRNRKEYGYYFCKNSNLGSCPQRRYCRMDLIEQNVIELLMSKAESIAKFAHEPVTVAEDPKITELRDQLSGLELLGANPAIESAKQEIQLQIQNLRSVAQVQDEEQESLNNFLASVNAQACNNPLYWELLPQSEKRSIYRLLVDQILITSAEDETKRRYSWRDWRVEVFLKL